VALGSITDPLRFVTGRLLESTVGDISLSHFDGVGRGH
jgi:hypothetical protein